MEHEATINARIPASLKQSGSAVLNRNGVSPTELIRSMYRYMATEQCIPECLGLQNNDALTTQKERRALARSIAGSVTLLEPLDTKALRMQRIEQKYGDAL